MWADAIKQADWRVSPLIWLAAVMMAVAAWAGMRMTPSHFLADDKPPVALESMVPMSFAGWQVDPSQAVLLVDPSLKKAIDALYTQTLSRLYVGPSGERVLLSIAYGRNQNSESTAAHRPEFCYSAQGFIVSRVGVAPLDLGSHQINVVRLDAYTGERREPISYWVTLNDEPALPGWQRKVKQLQYGLQGQIVDGMLVRVSTLRGRRDNTGLESDFALQGRFLREMSASMPPEVRVRFFGR